MTSIAQTPTAANRHRFSSRWMLVGCSVVFLFLLIQAATYSGIIEWLAEWQFARFGRYFPALTIGLILLLFVGLWLIASRLRRRARKQKILVDPVIRDSRRLASAANFMFVSVGLGGLLALGTFISSIQQPSMDGTPAVADLSGGEVALKAGPMRLTGLSAVGPISRHAEDVMLFRATRYFAPVGSTRLEDGTPAFNLFVEVEGPQEARLRPRMNGLMRFNALPLEVVEMYNGAGYPTARRSAVLFRTETSADRPALLLAAEFLVYALIAAAFGLLLRRRERRILRALEG
jgi:hypothetical protein